MVINYSEIHSYLLSARKFTLYNSVVDSLLINKVFNDNTDYILFIREFELYTVHVSYSNLSPSTIQTRTFDILLSYNLDGLIDKWLLDISLGSNKLKEKCSMLGIKSDEEIQYVIDTRFKIASFYRERKDNYFFSLRTIKRTDVRRYFIHLQNKSYYK